MNDSNWFEVKMGGKQGNELSPIMFIIYMNYCCRLVSKRVNDEIFGYTDDLGMISETEKTLQRFIDV